MIAYVAAARPLGNGPIRSIPHWAKGQGDDITVSFSGG